MTPVIYVDPAPITATPDTATGSVLLEIDLKGTVERVLRTDANGVAEVRSQPGQLPAGNSTRVNLATNPSFETGTSGWTLGNTSWTLTTAAANPTAGGKVGLVTPAFSPAPPVELRHTFAVTAGKTYTVSMDLSLTGGDVVTYSVTGWSALSYSLPLGEWKRKSYTFTPTVTGTVTGVFTIPSRALRFAIDAVLVEEAPEPRAYFDGSVGASEGAVTSWTGTAHASTSRLVPNSKLILTDYEAAAGTVTYSIVGAAPAQVTTELELEGPWLLIPKAPNYAQRFAQVTTYEAGRESQTTLHDVIGREDPIATFGGLRTRSGSMDLYCSTLAEARSLETLLSRPDAVMLKQNVPGLDMYFTATGTRVRPHSEEGEGSSWALTVDYRELKRPVGTQAGALGWTFDALASAYPSFDAVAIAFATFDALTVRRPN